MTPLLRVTRTLWWAFVTGLLLLWFVLALIAEWDGGDEGWWPWLVVGLGIALHLVAIPFALRRMVRLPAGATQPALLVSYRDGMLVGMAVSESVALVAFVAVFLTGSQWLFPLSLPFALAGFWRVGPFASTLERCDRLLQEAGSPYRMSEAWREAGGPSTPLAPGV